MILVIDNFDSFVHNLARYLRNLGQEVVVVRNNALTAEDIARYQPAAIVLSPGPCTPAESGCCLDVVRAYYDRIPMLGVCLGHQVIGQALGGKIRRAETPVHGRATPIDHDGRGLFAGAPHPLIAARYHSLVLDEATLPECFEVSARCDGLIMGIRHRSVPLIGIQFHPESILTESGYELLTKFLKLAGVSDLAPTPRFEQEYKNTAARTAALARTATLARTAPITF